LSHPTPPTEPTLNAERERVVQRLSDAFAADDLALDQLESRMALVWQARSMDELTSLVADLPAKSVAPAPAPSMSVAESPTRKTLVAVMGGVVRRGVWRVPRRIRALALMGGIQIDLREAELSASVTEITAVAVMGGIQVIVPPGVRLESDGFALMGGFEDQAAEPASPSSAASAPLVRITGFALMGGVEAKVLARGVPVD
jgi:hypothetical protein